MQIGFGANWTIPTHRPSVADNIKDVLPEGEARVEENDQEHRITWDVKWDSPRPEEQDKRILAGARERFVTPAPWTGKIEHDEMFKPQTAAEAYCIDRARVES